MIIMIIIIINEQILKSAIIYKYLRHVYLKKSIEEILDKQKDHEIGKI